MNVSSSRSRIPCLSALRWSKGSCVVCFRSASLSLFVRTAFLLQIKPNLLMDIPAQIDRLQHTLRPKASSSVRAQLYAILVFFCLAAFLHFIVLCYKLIHSERSDLWLIRRNPSVTGQSYFTTNSLLIWLPVCLAFSGTSIASTWFFLTHYDGPGSNLTQYSMLACKDKNRESFPCG